MKILNIVDYGAVGDGKTVNTEAIQKTIDACPAGGTVLVPEGIFLSGAVFLKGDMTFEVNGKLLGTGRIEDFPIMIYRYEGLEQKCYSSLVGVKGDMPGEQIKSPYSIIHRNIKICGKGTIDGSGTTLFESEMAEAKAVRGRTLCIRNTDGVVIEGVTVRHSPSWCLHLIYCRNIVMRNMTINSKYDEDGNMYPKIFNNDGLDIDSCCGFLMENCLIESGDDCIAIKSGRDKEGRDVGVASENIEIKNCIFKSGWGVVVGSEMSGGVRNVYVHDCECRNTYSVGGIKARRGRGAIVENITFERMEHYNNLTEGYKDCKWFRGAVYVDAFYSIDEADFDKPEPWREDTPTFRNITYKDIHSATVAGNGIFICGLPEQPVEHINLINVRSKGTTGMHIKHVHDLVFEDVNLEIIPEETVLSWDNR